MSRKRHMASRPVVGLLMLIATLIVGLIVASWSAFQRAPAAAAKGPADASTVTTQDRQATLSGGVFASGTGGDALRSEHYQILCTVGESALPVNETALESERFRHEPGFLAAAKAAARPTPTHAPVAMPLIMKPHRPDIVANGSFEVGLSGWEFGGNLGVWSQETASLEGSASALLCSPNYDCERAPEGEAWVQQWIRVPNSETSSLAFWYRIVTYDRNKLLDDRADYFEAVAAGQQVLKHMKVFGEDWGDCAQAPDDLGWREGVVDLSPWRGRVIPIRFRVHTDHEFNTWVFLDDVKVR